jgi:hypothetical protein
LPQTARNRRTLNASFRIADFLAETRNGKLSCTILELYRYISLLVERFIEDSPYFEKGICEGRVPACRTSRLIAAEHGYPNHPNEIGLWNGSNMPTFSQLIWLRTGSRKFPQ